VIRADRHNLDREAFMHRRNILAAALAAVGATVSATAKVARAEPAKPRRAKVAYHLCDLDKVQFVMGNIQNHFDGVGGPDKITIALVVHGPALKALQQHHPEHRPGHRQAGAADQNLAHELTEEDHGQAEDHWQDPLE
jgi:hypothetical protein